jgi:hypothetical protein
MPFRWKVKHSEESRLILVCDPWRDPFSVKLVRAGDIDTFMRQLYVTGSVAKRQAIEGLEVCCFDEFEGLDHGSTFLFFKSPSHAFTLRLHRGATVRYQMGGGCTSLGLRRYYYRVIQISTPMDRRRLTYRRHGPYPCLPKCSSSCRDKVK